MFPLLQFGSVVVPVPGLALIVGVWVGLWLAEREAGRLQLNPDAVYNVAFTGLVAGVVGARLAYAAGALNAYLRDPWSLVSLHPVSLAPVEGLLIGCIAALIDGARRKLPLRLTLDAFAPALALMGVAMALAHLASGDAFGAPARLPWSIYLWDDYRHPAQVYELLGALAILGFTWRWRARGPFVGFNFLLVVALSAAARLLLEAFRGDSHIVLGGVRAAQAWSLLVLAASLWLMGHWSRPADPGPTPASPGRSSQQAS